MKNSKLWEHVYNVQLKVDYYGKRIRNLKLNKEINNPKVDKTHEKAFHRRENSFGPQITKDSNLICEHRNTKKTSKRWHSFGKN